MSRATLALLVLTTLISATAAQERPKAQDDRAPAARQFSPVGTLLAREAAAKSWSLPALYDPVQRWDEFVALPGARAILELKEGDVRLSLLGNLPMGNLPEASAPGMLESVVRLHADKDFDLDLTLDRGRIVVESRAEKGAVRVRCRFRGNVVNIELEPKTMIALERVSFWPPGVPFLKNAPKDHEPASEVTFLALKGISTVTFEGEQHAIPAPVMYQWSVGSGVSGPFPLKKLPAWLTPGADKAARTVALHAAVEKVRLEIAERKELRTFKDVVNDKDQLVRAVAVLSAGSIDEIGLMLEALGDGKHAEARQAAALGLRHWIAREPGYDQRLYDLLRHNKYSAGEAETVLQLLHSFGDRDLARPETYQTLIDYLGNPKIAVRELGHAQLVRLVPSGRDIPFNAGGAPKALERAQAAWRKLIPRGQLPQRD